MMTLIKKQRPLLTGFPELTDNFFNEAFFPEFKFFENFPPTNIEETDKAYSITMAIPGLDKKDVKVEMDRNLLTISSEKMVDKEEVDKNFTRKEYSYNSFKRTFTLPENTELEKISATFKNGELMLKIPKNKVEIKKSRLIEIS